MKKLLAPAFLVLAAAAAAGCPAQVEATRGCDDNSQCSPGICIDGKCQDIPAGEPPPPPPVQQTGEGEGEGAPAEGEGEGEGAPVDVTLHFARGAFVGGERPLSSAHFSLLGAVTSSRRP